jgi:hypothetical protein
MKRKLQVFVSSTYVDLLVERQAAVSAILKSGHIPAGMELFTSGDKSQLETIKRWIDESDAYMLILGGRYGSIEPISGISYIELEYDYALQQGKPLFAVVINDVALEEKVRSQGSSVIEKENPKALDLFRRKVLSNMSSFFSDEKDIKLCVHESLADFKENLHLKGWIYAGDVEDPKPLHEEIAALRKELQARKGSEGAQHKTPAKRKETMLDYDEILELLKTTEVNIPAKLVDGEKNVVRRLLDVFVKNKENLIIGVTDAFNASDGETFLYSSVCPKLMVHGLVDNEKVPGVRYRRSYVNAKGLAFLGQAERNIMKNRASRRDAKKEDRGEDIK